MKVFKKLVLTVLSLFIISSSYSVAQAETDSLEDNKGKNTNFSVLTEVQNNRSSKSLLRSSYDLDDVISYPKDYTNVSRSLEFEDNTKWPLFVSNSPEMFNRQGILAYSTEVNRTGKFRIYWAHQNYNDSENYVGFYIKNTSGKKINVNFKKRAHVESRDGAKLGQEVLQKYLESSHKTYKYATLSKNQSTYVGFPVAKRYYGSGMYDITITDENDDYVTGGIELKTYATYDGKGDPSRVIKENTVLKDDGHQIRGLFPTAIKSFKWRAYAGEQISFSPSYTHVKNNNLNSPWKIPDNDISKGIDEASNNKTVYNYGNYGMTYEIGIKPREDVQIVFAPNLSEDQRTTRKEHYLALDADDRGVLINTVIEDDGWVVLNAKSDKSYYLTTSLPGYHWAPLRIAAIPK
ncbi:hypothetical protein [Bacillus cereus]|uniref:hypothetical protein n=1 Tax=Bacillus cereus TaxID=1396 RepID=UPI000B4BF1AB|nr:hypothetical protein [Bacillus cereus]